MTATSRLRRLEVKCSEALKGSPARHKIFDKLEGIFVSVDPQVIDAGWLKKQSNMMACSLAMNGEYPPAGFTMERLQSIAKLESATGRLAKRILEALE